MKTKKRIYVCHTYYHVYVSILKEFQLTDRQQGEAEIALSTMSTDFEQLSQRLMQSQIFRQVHILEEKRDTEFEELMKYHKNYHNFARHIFNRIIYTKKYARLEEPYMTIDFKAYEDIYVFCDSDPIGYYLNAKHIPYHALEDGLNCLKVFDDAHVANKGHFAMKAFLASKNIIFIQNGFSKYCIDMEINDRSVLEYDCPKYKEVPRKAMEKALNHRQKEKMLRVFIPQVEELLQQLQRLQDKKKVLLLTEPYHFEDETQIQIVKDIVASYCSDMEIVIKPHPRDDIDYRAEFPGCVVIRGKFPIEVMNFLPNVEFEKAISIITSAMDSLDFVKEKVNLGVSFWDAYEDPKLHDFT